jgi:excisionase family DNA binding protein
MYSTREAAKLLGLSPDHVKLLARNGVIEAKKVGRDWVVLSLDYQRKRRPKGGQK